MSGGAHPDGAMAQVNRDLADLSSGTNLKLGGERKAPIPQVIRIKDPQPAKTTTRAKIGKRAKANPKVKTPLKNPERIGKGGKGIPQAKPPRGKVTGQNKAPPAKAASRIPLATKAQAKAVKPMRVKQQGKTLDKGKQR